jgi:hypothetical protein
MKTRRLLDCVISLGIQDSVHTLKMVAASRPSGRPVQGLLTL